MQGSTGLHQAAMHGHAKVVQSLLEYGADANARTADVRRSFAATVTTLVLPADVCYSMLHVNVVCQTSALDIRLMDNCQVICC